MPKDIKVKQLDAAIQYSSGGWTIDYDGNLGNGHSDPYPIVKAKKDEGPHFVVFKIHDSPNVTFSPSDPIWVSAAGKPPPQSTDPQIGGWQVKDAGKTLVVFDWNTQAVELDYQLNFVGARPLDPVIQNGGGGGGQPGIEYAWVQILLTAAIFLGIGILLQKRFKLLKDK